MSFDGIARYYRALELLTAGGKLQRCRLEFLPDIPVPRRILLAGEGHGRFLPECARRFPEAEIVVIDASSRMLEIASSKTVSQRVKFIHADLLDWPAPTGRFDLIVTHFFLDCFTPHDLELVVAKLGRASAPQATWLLADFEPTGWRARTILWLLYRFFGLVSGLKARELVRPDTFLAAAGFHKNLHRTYDWGLLKSEWWTRGGLKSTTTFPTSCG